MRATKPVLIAVLGAMLLGSASWGQESERDLVFSRTLFLTHAAFDPLSQDLLVASNSWRDQWPKLRRIHEDGTLDEEFRLQRFERCCAIHPSLVACDGNGNIYTLEYQGRLEGFFIYKHAPSGELDLDWGERDEPTPSLSPMESDEAAEEQAEDETGGGFEEAETTLTGNAGGGRLEYAFNDPVDLVPRSDGSLLVLDRFLRYVYRVDPDGRDVEYFIGRQGYYPVRPQRLIQDSEGYLYLVDYYDNLDFDRAGDVGVFRFTPDGEQEMGWGEGVESINDQWGPELDFSTIVCDGSDTLILLGSGFSGSNHSEVFAFDRQTGARLSRNNVEYRLGWDDYFVGMLPRTEGGFVVLENRDFEIMVNYYLIDGTREHLLTVDQLYYSD